MLLKSERSALSGREEARNLLFLELRLALQAWDARGAVGTAANLRLSAWVAVRRASSDALPKPFLRSNGFIQFFPFVEGHFRHQGSGLRNAA
jgi:hypothetical protein